ncbi:hypothetical protein EDEG_04176 [Edhazardia aedis USNM 41457]|uniref:Uncharacterized protein n=1 Tax=Edhazardia aedis (strain USNM 41457) TaxID=1003232 RepID=J9DAT1_EDHAE|nr:hypothetical protein EDEG_04176 [Edhazardia aedis USNM 41457]|eukprot:EJW04871.1 hypothetical protein EDEG_04176 [Edhazardia aedis USNM 41457]
MYFFITYCICISYFKYTMFICRVKKYFFSMFFYELNIKSFKKFINEQIYKKINIFIIKSKKSIFYDFHMKTYYHNTIIAIINLILLLYKHYAIKMTKNKQELYKKSN